MRRVIFLVLSIALISSAANLVADDLTLMAQQELTSLGYDVGDVNGEASTKTIIAISKFQSEQGMDVTGEASPQLIGALRAAGKQGSSPAVASSTATDTAAPEAMTAEQQQADLAARQQACLQEKYTAAQESGKKKRGFGKLLSAVARTSSRFGGGGLASDIALTAGTVYSVNATAGDLSGAAKDLGLTEDEVEACRNP